MKFELTNGSGGDRWYSTLEGTGLVDGKVQKIAYYENKPSILVEKGDEIFTKPRVKFTAGFLETSSMPNNEMLELFLKTSDKHGIEWRLIDEDKIKKDRNENAKFIMKANVFVADKNNFPKVESFAHYKGLAVMEGNTLDKDTTIEQVIGYIGDGNASKFLSEVENEVVVVIGDLKKAVFLGLVNEREGYLEFANNSQKLIQVPANEDLYRYTGNYLLTAEGLVDKQGLYRELKPNATPVQEKSSQSEDIEALKQEYTELYGKPPHHMIGAEKLKVKIAEKRAELE